MSAATSATGRLHAFAIASAVFCFVAALDAAAQKGTGAPDAGWGERDYLLHYAMTVCVRSAYGGLEPSSPKVLEALDREAWAMVELTRQKPAVYEAIHVLATAQGRQEAPARALAGCGAWAKRNAAEILKHADGAG